MPNDQTTTNEILGFLQEHMLTKEEAKDFATKQDIDKLVTKVIDIESQLDTFATKDDLRHVEDRIANALDHQLVILRRLDEERVFMSEWIKRIESEVERIKLHLKIV